MDTEVEGGYCVKCKSKQIMVNPVTKETKNGRKMRSGACKKCGTKMCRFIKG